MRRLARLAMLAVALILATGAALHADDAPAAPPTAPALEDPLRLIEDINSLALLSNLALTDAQIDAICALYVGPDGWLHHLTEDKTMAQIRGLRGRLIRGETVAMEEFQALNQAVLGVLQQNDFLDKVQKVLTPEQVAELAQPFHAQMQAAAAKAGGGPQVEMLLQQLGALRGLEDDQWVAETNKLLDDMAAQAGAQGTAANEQTRRNFTDFLIRVRKMDDKQFADGQKALLENLKAIAPPTYVPKLVQQPQELRRPATMVIFMRPQMYVLLQEMKQARHQPLLAPGK